MVHITKCVIRDHCISRVVCGEYSSSIENYCLGMWKCHSLVRTYTAAKRGCKVLNHSGVRQKVVFQLDDNFML